MSWRSREIVCILVVHTFSHKQLVSEVNSSHLFLQVAFCIFRRVFSSLEFFRGFSPVFLYRGFVLYSCCRRIHRIVNFPPVVPTLPGFLLTKNFCYGCRRLKGRDIFDFSTQRRTVGRSPGKRDCHPPGTELKDFCIFVVLGAEPPPRGDKSQMPSRRNRPGEAGCSIK